MPVKNNAIVLTVHILSINDVKPALSFVLEDMISDPLEKEKEFSSSLSSSSPFRQIF